MKKEMPNTPTSTPAIADSLPLSPVLFNIRQMNGILRGHLTIDKETSALYRRSGYEDQSAIRIGLSHGVSEHFKTDCYVTEVLNG